MKLDWPASPRLRHALVWSGMGVLALAFWHSAFARLESTGPFDWQFYIQLWEASRIGIQRFGELPLWNPYQCGGITLWGNPQNPQFSPLFLPALLLGTTVAMKLRLVLLTAIGLMGTYVLARRVYAISPIASLLAAVAWACSGFFSWHIAVGHSSFQGFWLFPWVLYYARRAETDARFCAAAAGVIFFMVLDGATYPLPYLALLLGVDTLVRLALSHDRRERLRIFGALAWTGVLALSMAALRVIPTLTTLARLPRNLTDNDFVSVPYTLVMLTARGYTTWRLPPPHFTWPEYGSFVGWVVLVLGVAGLVLCIKRHPSLTVGAVVFFLCMLGSAAPFLPWPWLKRLPVLESLRIPARFVVLFTLHLGLMAGVSLDWLRERLERWQRPGSSALRAALIALLVVAATADIFVVNWRTNDAWTGRELAKAQPEGRYHFASIKAFDKNYASLPQEERGTSQCYEALAWPVPPGLWNGDVPQARITGAGQIADWGHTTNTMWADVQLPEPARVVFNQTFAPGWQSSHGTLVEDAGRTAVDAVPGRYRLELRYRPPEMALSLSLTLLGLVLTLLTAWLATSRRIGSLGRHG